MYKILISAIALLLLCGPRWSSATEQAFTVYVEPGKEDCFFERIKMGETFELEYQVIDGGHGDLDITLRVVDPTGRVVLVDYKKSENNHRVEAPLDGDYRICFDNTFSSYNSKQVFFELIVYKMSKDGSYVEEEDIMHFQPELSHEMKIQDIADILEKVKEHLRKVRHLQDLIKSTEARDRNVAEENYLIVNTFSMSQLILMLVVGMVQVVMVRSLFDEKSRVHRMWKKLDQPLR